jgi:outer membrane receptor protein involved in Fe transport
MRVRQYLAGGTAWLALLPAALISTPVLAQDATADAPSSGEIVVTATRKSEALSKVPISVSAYGQEQIVKQGIRAVEDIVRLTPGVSIRKSGTAVGNISIRGISSAAGASTIGVYIDDTPIQVRSLGVSSSINYPAMFDLERIEILRGPQGTLFGAGSEGGTIRFIQPEPSLTKWSGMARAELGTTQNGAASYEGGYAMGGPIVTDKIGFRASVYYRHDGGFIDKATGTPTVLNATGAAGANSLIFSNVNTYKSDVNWGDTFAARLALKFQPTEWLTITPSVNYQRFYSPDVAPSVWASLSDFGSGDYKEPRWNPSVDSTHLAINAPKGEPQKDKFLLPSLKIQGDLGFADLISTTSYYKRDMHQTLDYTAIYEVSYASRSVPLPGDAAISTLHNTQRNFTQEVRLQSSGSSRLTWLAGGFYSRNKQRAQQLSETNFLPYLPTVFGATTNGAPFGPGTSAFLNYYGVGQLNGTGSYASDFQTIDTQIAGFGEASYNFFDKLKLTAGVRVSRNKVKYQANYAGPAANLSAPRGLACVPGTGTGTIPCSAVAIGQYAVGTGPFTPTYLASAASGADNAVTPKVAVSYQATPTTLLYASASKGFRPSGAQVALPGNCNVELVQLGYANSAGQAQSPETYKSDSVWSYEGGAKTRLLGGKVSLGASAFLIKWKNIQSTVAVNSCLQSLTDNLGSATSKGFDFQAQVSPINGLTLGAAVGYTDATFDKSTVINGRTLYTGGSALPNSGSPWTVTITGDYSLPIEGHTYYAHADYIYNSRQRRTGATDSGTFSYDPLAPVTAGYYVVNGRVGVQFGDLDLSVFMNNILNATPKIGLGHTKNQPIYTTFVIRPRTTGLTASFRY